MKMSKLSISASVLFVISVSVSGVAHGNDGIDAHKGDKGTVFEYFPEPSSKAEGYRILPHDFEGGADGKSEFRWARPFAVTVTQYLSMKVARDFGISPYPLSIFDLSAENGDTPVMMNKDKLRGRHPGDSHDGGINIDLGYYLKDEKGIKYTPDFSACTGHFDDKGEDAYKCTGEADRLDVGRQTYFYLNLFKLNKEIFNKTLLKEIGIDREIEKKVLVRMKKWIAQGTNYASEELLEDMMKIFTNDPFEGWARAHHHHTHIRFFPVDEIPRLRDCVDAVEKMKEVLEKKLLKEKVVIKGGVYSYNFSRYVEFELKGIKREDIQFCFFRINGGDWEDGLLWKHACRGSKEISEKMLKINIEVKFKKADGKQVLFKKVFSAPPRPPFIYLSAEPYLFNSGCKQDQHCFLAVNNVLGPMITSVKFFSLGDGEEELKKGFKETEKNGVIYYFIKPAKSSSLIVKINLSGRKEIWFPVNFKIKN